MESVDVWRKDNDFALLCCPYFEYPLTKSAIYKQALELNVSLFSWEYFSFLLKNNIKESFDVNLSKLWNYSKHKSESTFLSDVKNNFLCSQNKYLTDTLGLEFNLLKEVFLNSIAVTKLRGHDEINYWKNEIEKIKNYSKDEAIQCLLDSLKLNKKIESIQKFLSGLVNVRIE